MPNYVEDVGGVITIKKGYLITLHMYWMKNDKTSKAINGLSLVICLYSQGLNLKILRCI